MESTFEERFTERMAFYEAVHDESDLGRVLITATYLDNALSIILKAFFVEGRAPKELMSGPTAPLGTFSSRTMAAYALGLIDEREYKSINAIRAVRNKFAHNIQAKLTDPQVRAAMNPLAWAVGKEATGDTDPEQVFFLASERLASQMMNRADHVRAQRLKPREWPMERVDYDPDYDPVEHLY